MTSLEFFLQAAGLLAQAAIMAVVALGAWIAMGDGDILHFMRRFIEQTIPPDEPTDKAKHIFPSWVRNPLAACPRCMCSVWGIVALLLLGFGVGIQLDFTPSDMMTFNDAMELVPVDEPWIRVDWSRLAQIPVLILTAVGLQEMLHRP